MNSTSRVERNSQIVLVNALPQTLDHYQQEFETVVGLIPGFRVSEVITEKGDGQASLFSKLYAAINILAKRSLSYSGSADRMFIVMWPLFGYLDVLTWIRLARKSPVIVIIHDPVPLRAQIGYSSFSAKILKMVSTLNNIHVLAHTQNAQEALLVATGVSASVAPHPLGARAEKNSTVQAPGNCKTTVRILGQYKEARSLDPIRAIAEGLHKNAFHLEIRGRGWTPQEGWTVVDRFLTAVDFDNSIRTADCVVIPYSRFYQSGVAVRCLEALVPIVGPRHPHLEELYGINWPGLVDEKTTWAEAVLNVTGRGYEKELQRLLDSAVENVSGSWKKLLNSKSDVSDTTKAELK